jgi:hypothetical protein
MPQTAAAVRTAGSPPNDTRILFMTTINPSAQEAANQARDVPDERHAVTVELNGTARQIQAGTYTGRSLRLALAVPLEYELEEVVRGEFKPIANDATVHIKGGETFVSHVGHGRAS